MAARHALDNRLSPSATMGLDRWSPTARSRPDRTRLTACSPNRIKAAFRRFFPFLFALPASAAGVAPGPRGGGGGLGAPAPKPCRRPAAPAAGKARSPRPPPPPRPGPYACSSPSFSPRKFRYALMRRIAPRYSQHIPTASCITWSVTMPSCNSTGSLTVNT